MNLLFFDTSVDQGFVALFEEGRIHRAVVPAGPLFDLTSIFKDLLQSTGLSIKDLNCIAVGIGPGSYTGMRKSASVACALSYATGLPLIGLSSLEGYVPQADGPFASLMDAKRGKVFFQLGEKVLGHIKYDGEPRLLTVSQVKEYVGQDYRLVSPHREVLEPLFETNKWECGDMDLDWVAKNCRKRYLKGDFVKEWPLKLLYLQEPYIS